MLGKGRRLCKFELADYPDAQKHGRRLQELRSRCLAHMRILPRTVNDALNRKEEIKPKEPEVISNCTPFNIFGQPAISIPCGFAASGLPIGLMIAGPRFSEGKVLALAHAYEKATEWHTRRPSLTPDMAVPPVTRKT